MLILYTQQTIPLDMLSDLLPHWCINEVRLTPENSNNIQNTIVSNISCLTSCNAHWLIFPSKQRSFASKSHGMYVQLSWSVCGRAPCSLSIIFTQEWSNFVRLLEWNICNYFVGSWSPFIISLPYDYQHPSAAGNCPIKTLVAKQRPTSVHILI